MSELGSNFKCVQDKKLICKISGKLSYAMTECAVSNQATR